MVTVIQSNGTIVKTQPDRVYQGSNKVNQIVLVGAFSQNLIPQIAFKLPQTETFTTFDYMTSANIPTGTGLSGWTYDIPVAVTQYYGQVEFQIQVTDISGNIVASGLCSFEVERGVPPDTSSIPDIDPFDTIIQIIQSIQGDIENGFLMSKGLLPYDLTFEYPLNAVVFDPNTKDMFVSLQSGNKGNALSDSSYWQSLKTYTGLQEQITTNEQAIQINTQNIADNTQLIEQLQEEFANFESFQIQIVQELPETGKSNIMYLVPIEGQDAYGEYVWLSEEQRFELIGTTQVDLSDYYTKEKVNTLLANKVDTSVFNNLSSEVTTNSEDIITLQTSVETLTTDLSDTDGKVTTLQTEVNNNTQNISTNTQNIETNTQNISSINQTLSTKADSSTVNALSENVTENSNSIETINTEIENLTSQVENAVLVTPQTLTLEQQAQARTNIGAETIFNTVVLSSSSWIPLSSSNPYTYSTTVNITSALNTNSIVELLNNQPTLFATYGFAIGSISGQVATIYSIGQPSESVTLTLGVTG